MKIIQHSQTEATTYIVAERYENHKARTAEHFAVVWQIKNVLRDCLQAPSGDLREVRQFPAADETVDWRVVIEFFHEFHRLRKRPRSPESNTDYNTM